MTTDDKRPDSSGDTGGDQTVIRLLEIVQALSVELNPARAGRVQFSLDSRLDSDLGFDSLARVELLARLEREFDVVLPEAALMRADTARDLLRAVSGASQWQVTGIPERAEPLSIDASVAVPRSAQTLLEVLEWHVSQHPERPHLRLYSDDGDGEILRYVELWNGARRMAAGLFDLGVSPGEPVVIMLPTGADYFKCFIGVLMAGGIPVPVYPPGRPSQLEEHLLRHVVITENCKAAVMIVPDEALRFARLMRARAASLRYVMTAKGLCNGNELNPLQRAGGDTALLQYTSGSTGAPKGVVLTHDNLLANIRAMGRALNVKSADVFVSWLPLYHDMGLIGAWLGSLYHGVHLVVMSPLAFIARPERWLVAIHRFGGSLSAAPNFAYELCVRRIADEIVTEIDLGGWRHALNGAEAVSPRTITRFVDRFRSAGFRPEAMMPVYGLAECSVGLAFPPPNRIPLIDRISREKLTRNGRAEPASHSETHVLEFVSCGQPLTGHQVRIVDRAGREMPDRSEGRIQFCGPSVTTGYYHAPNANRSLFDGQWLESGDRGYVADGELFVTGREKDIVIRAGQNIYPEELEERIGRLDGIRAGAVAVFASSDSSTGTERLIVMAETRRLEDAARARKQAEIEELVNDVIGAPADEVLLVPPNTVPRTSSGKIRRTASRQLYESGHPDRARSPLWLQMLRIGFGALGPQARRLWRESKASIYAAYCWALFIGAALPLWLAIRVLPDAQWRWRTARKTLRVLIALAGISLTTRDLDNVRCAGPAKIIVSNHQSYLDALILFAVLPKPVCFVAKSELSENYFVRSLLTRLGTEFVERVDAERSAETARRLQEVARSDRSLLFFAEGTFTRSPGLLPFRLGAFETAVASGLPLVPLVIRGTRSILRGDDWFPRRGGIVLHFGPALRPEGSEFADQLRLRDSLRRWMLAHLGEPDLGDESVSMPGSGPRAN